MSAPVPIKVSGPPPGPPPRAPRKPRAARPSAIVHAWAPPSGAPVNFAPPTVKPPRDAYAGIQVTRSEYTCLPREGNDRLTACGRLLFLDAIRISDNPTEVTCCFCQMRLRNQA